MRELVYDIAPPKPEPNIASSVGTIQQPVFRRSWLSVTARAVVSLVVVLDLFLAGWTARNWMSEQCAPQFTQACVTSTSYARSN